MPLKPNHCERGKKPCKTIQDLGTIENWTNSQNFDIQR
jgi:hypothetical protein